MFLKEVSFLNVRKIKIFSEKFSKHTTIITGNNGTGKTTILEAVFFLLTAKSFRKKYRTSIIQKGQEELKIKGTIKEKEDVLQIEYKNRKKRILKNNKQLFKTSDLLKETSVVCISPEEENIITSYTSKKLKYFDKILFKAQPEYTKTIREYNKLLNIRNTLLEENKDTAPWDEQIIKKGLSIWEERKKLFKEIEEKIIEVQKEIKNEKKYSITYKKTETKNEKEYIQELTKNKFTTSYGPHKDKILFFIDSEPLEEHGSQGEKKLFRYILKLAEAVFLFSRKKEKPILLLDDFFAKLDDENIMKIFSYFHRKFQTIITTTDIKETPAYESIKKESKKEIKHIFLND